MVLVVLGRASGGGVQVSAAEIAGSFVNCHDDDKFRFSIIVGCLPMFDNILLSCVYLSTTPALVF